ncbi:MAG: DUF1232 domain-containing protein [Myxococcota bacterium]|nr:DUF1232 domain-containing protein [Myxococcota bacterium]
MSALSPPITIDVNPPQTRLWDRLRAHVTAPRPPSQRSGLRDMALLLPDLTVLLARLLRDDRVPVGRKWVAVVGIAYVVSPLDFLPSLLLGPVGLVDDLIIVAACLSGIVNRVHPDVVRSHWSGQGDALEAIERATGWVEDQISGGLQSIFQRFRSD